MADASSSNNAVVNPEDTGSLGNGHSKQLADPELEAAEALGGLRHAVSPPPPGSPLSAVETTLPTVTKTADFISRVSNYPVVNSGIERISRIYEAGKESHAIVKFGAQTVESVGTSVIKKLEPALGPPLRSLDRFASNSLDRLEQYVPGFKSGSGSGSSPRPDDDFMVDTSGQFHAASTSSPPHLDSVPLPPPSPGLARTEGGYGGTAPLIQRNKPRSTWSTIVTNVGGYVISEETMRGLRYCLQWLQYATSLIDSRIQLLKSYLARLVPGGVPPSSSRTLQIPDGNGGSANPNVVAGVKKDVVEALRNAVDVVGRYAAVVLPNDSRDSVRQFVLSLPTRFSRLSTSTGSAAGGTPQEEAETVLAFAAESRTMLGGVETVFRQSFERAESILNRIGFSTSGWNAPPEEQREQVVQGAPADLEAALFPNAAKGVLQNASESHNTEGDVQADAMDVDDG